MEAKAPHVSDEKRRRARQLSGAELTLLLRQLDAAITDEERRHWLREYMRGFYGDERGCLNAEG